jgi:hypothetical protein
MQGNGNAVGDIVAVRVTGVASNSLFGEVDAAQATAAA